MHRQLQGVMILMESYNIKPNFTQLSKEYRVDRHTIAKYWKQKGIIKTERFKGSYLDEYRDEIEKKFEECKTTKMALYQYFKDKYGKEVFRSYSNFSHYTHDQGFHFKKEKTAHVRFETGPGKQLQVDWKESIKFRFKDKEEIEFNLYAATYGYSRFHYFIYSKSRTTEDFLRCTIEVLRRTGGMPQEILTDNMAAIASITNGEKRKHELIKQFEKDTGIMIRLCKVRSPQTKGKVESSNRYVEWLRPYQGELKDEAELIMKIEQLSQVINQQCNQTTQIPPCILIKKEMEYFNPIANPILLENYIQNVQVQTVPTTLLVRYRGNQYSVSSELIGKRVKIVPIENQLYIYDNTKLCCIHTISEKKFNYQLDHYTTALRNSGVQQEQIEQRAKENLELLSQFKGGHYE